MRYALLGISLGLALAVPAQARSGAHATAFLKSCGPGNTYAIDIKKRGMTCNLARQVIRRNHCGDDCSFVLHGREYGCTTHTSGTNIYWRCATTGGHPF